MNGWPRKLFILAAAVVVLSIGLKAADALKPYVDAPVRQLHIDRDHRDIDWGLLNGGLNQVHSFRDTGRWWTNTWCGGVPFWRPLTSYVFWVERLIWPAEYMLPRQIILVIAHLCFTALAALLIWRLTRRPWLLLLTMQFFAGMRPNRLGDPQAYVRPVNDALADPKNIPDPLVGLAIIGSLLLLTRGRWLGALALAAVSVGFKEVGFTAWPLAVVVLAWMNRERLAAPDRLKYITSSIRRNRIPIAAWTLAFGALALIHYISVGVGYQQGSNTFWIWRAAVWMGWPTVSNLFLFDRTAGFMACFLFAAILLSWRWRLVGKLLILLVAIAGGILVDTRLQQTTWDVSMVRLVSEGGSLGTTGVCLLWLFVIWFGRHDWRHIALGAVMAYIAAAPSWMAAQTWAHARYTASVFMEMAVASVLIQNVKTITGFVTGLRRTHGSERTDRVAVSSR